jgi:GH25 family lysozyme M1 (1,4-beta-N-acetylmuramidase)
MSEVVDLSYYQNAVDFAQLATSVSGVILRGGDGTYQDAKLEPYATGARANGLTIEAYHYLRTKLPPDQMAAECIRTCERVKTEIGQYPDIFWPDMEDTSNDGMAVADRVLWLSDLYGYLDKEPYPSGLYTGPWYWSSRMGGTQAFRSRLLWTADYRLILTGQAGIDAGWGPSLYGGWTSWHTWQYTSSGSRPGVSGNVDCDYRAGGTTVADEKGQAAAYAFAEYMQASAPAGSVWPRAGETVAQAWSRALGELASDAQGTLFPILKDVQAYVDKAPAPAPAGTPGPGPITVEGTFSGNVK